MYESIRRKSTSFSSLLGIDTVTVFLHGVHLSPKKKVVTGSNGLWHAVKNRKGTRLIMQMSHGENGKKWQPASRKTVRNVIQTVSKEFSQYVPGGVAVAYIVHRLRNASMTQTDSTWDLLDVRPNLAEIVAPKDKYGTMRTKRFGNGVTRYWGRRAGYMKNPDDTCVLDEDGERIYERGTAKQIRVYDKRKQMMDTRGIDIGRDVTRIEVTLTGNRTIRQNLGFGTLGEYLDCTDAELRLRTLFDELTVSVDGQFVDPLTPSQRREAEGKPRLAKKLRRNERRREKMQSLGNTGEKECQDTHCLYEGEGPGAWEFRRGVWSFIPEDPCLCPGAGGTPGRADDEVGAG